MRVDPAIAALRRDPALQRQAQQTLISACENWRAGPDVAPLVADLARYGSGASLHTCRGLAALFTKPGLAAKVAGAMVRRFCGVLAEQPFGQMPFRHAADGQVASLLLLRAGRAQLVLHAREPGQWTHDQASFSDEERTEIVLAGRGEGQIVRPPENTGAPLPVTPIAWRRGFHHTRALRNACPQVTRVNQRLVVLRVNRHAAMPAPTRHYRMADGTLSHQSAGSLHTSRQEMMLAILGRMGRTEAAPEMAALAGDRHADESLRWQALRECLALDSGVGFAALSHVAQEHTDPLAKAAAALRAQLAEAHPQLDAMEQQPCLA